MKRDLIPWRKRREPTSLTREVESPVLELHRRMNELFEDFFEGFGEGFRWPMLSGVDRPLPWLPSTDVSETDGEIRVSADLPGLDEKDIQVTLENDVLTIRGEKKQEHEEKEREYRVSERSYGVFHRIIPLPAGVDPNKVKATFKKGVLTVTVHKTPELKSHGKTIDVLPE